MKLSEILKDVPHEMVQMGATEEILSITLDSRDVKAGSLFVCIRGLTTDGHEFIDTAVKAGAVAIMVEDFGGGSGGVNPEEGGWVDEAFATNASVSIIRVKNTRQAMAYVAANFHGNPAEKLRFIGVTGTNGKTTTTYFIEEILRGCGRSTGLIGTVGAKVNNKPLDIAFTTSTTPDPLELHSIFAKMVEMGVQDVVMEVSSHALALYKVEGLTFNVGVFTNLTQDHLDFHGTMDNYRLAKAKLFTQSNFAVLNVDDESTPVMLDIHGHDPYLTYSIESHSDMQAVDIQYQSQGFEFNVNDEKFTLPINGRFNIYNTLAAIGSAKALGLPMDGIRAAVAQLSGVPGRIQSVPNNRNVHVLVDYAHSPDGLANIIPSVRDFTTGRVITLFGCGGDRDKTKRPIMGEIAAKLSDYCILTSDNPRTEDPLTILAEIEVGTKATNTPYEICENRKTAIQRGIAMLKSGDALIIAGKGHEDYQEIGTEKIHFSDFECAEAFLKD